MYCKFCQISLTPSSDICQDTNQLLFKLCQGSEDAPCSKPVPVNLSENPCCPLHLQLPPQMYIPEQVLCVPEELDTTSTDLYLSAAELRPTESLPLEFSDVSILRGTAEDFWAWGYISRDIEKMWIHIYIKLNDMRETESKRDVDKKSKIIKSYRMKLSFFYSSSV